MRACTRRGMPRGSPVPFGALSWCAGSGGRRASTPGEIQMSTYRVAQVAAAGGPFEIVEREVLQPGPGHVRVAVDACGICHSDAVFVNAALPDVRFPLVPGHEIAGHIEELGEGTQGGWQVG